jgi:hypothetical protein
MGLEAMDKDAEAGLSAGPATGADTSSNGGFAAKGIIGRTRESAAFTSCCTDSPCLKNINSAITPSNTLTPVTTGQIFRAFDVVSGIATAELVTADCNSETV